MARTEYDIRFSMVPVWLIEAGASTTALALFAALGKYASEKGAWPSRKTLAELLTISPSTVDRALVELRTKGAITTVQRKRPDGSCATNVHLLHVQKPAEETLTLTPDIEKGGIVTHDDTPSHPCVGVSSPMTRGLVTHDDPILELDPREQDPYKQTVAARRAPRQLMDHFKAQWRTRYHDDYVINGPKDAGLARTLLKSKSLDELKRRIDRYIASNDRFFVSSKHSFGVFYAAINRLIDEPDTGPKYRDIRDIMADYGKE